MRKRILLTLFAACVFTFLFSFSIFAAELIKSSSDEFGTLNTVSGINENTTITDKTSRVVLLNADGTYSTFPAYYISDVKLQWQGTVQYKFDALNSALGTSYSMDSIVRIEILTDSTIINQNGGDFRGRKNLKEVVFPEGTQIKELPGQQFKSCGIETICIPNTITSMGVNLFEDCQSLKEVTFEEGFSMTTLPRQMFNGCPSLERLIIPNCVIGVDGSLFNNCSSIKELRFGESFASYPEGGMSISNTAVIYAPATFLSNVSSISKNTFSSYTNYYLKTPTLFLTADKSVAEALVGKATLETLKNANLIEYDSTKPDSYYIPENPTVWTIVYNYNKCNAFYGYDHLESQTEYLYEGEKYLSNYYSYSGCTRCQSGIKEILCGPLFTNKGYTIEEDGTSFAYGITVNEIEIEKYYKLTGNRVSYGLITGKYTEGDDGKPVNTSAVALSEFITLVDLTLDKYDSYTVYSVKLTNIKTDAQKSMRLYCGAYIIDGESVSYIGEKTTDASMPVSYNAIASKDDE